MKSSSAKGRRVSREGGQLDFNDELLESMVRADHPYRKILELVDYLRGLIVQPLIIFSNLIIFLYPFLSAIIKAVSPL